MGIKKYNAPCLRRIGDLKEGTYILWQHHLCIIVKNKYFEFLKMICDLQTGKIDVLALEEIVSVVYEGVFKISADKPDSHKENNEQ